MNETEFYKTHINDSLEELIDLRNHLLRLIKDYEERFILSEIGKLNPRKEDLIEPSPLKRFENNNKYLIEVTKLILEKTKD